MQLRKRLPSLLTDIRFWIVFFLLIRLYGITNPPLEVGHNWRQTDGLMVARNFYESEANIFFPKVDVCGEKSGIVGSEFPILNYLIYLISLPFGYEGWYGRLIVLIVSSLGVYFLYKSVKKYFGESAAFNTAIIVSLSLWFSYSRKIIPDAFAASLCLIALYYALMYLEKGRFINLLLFFALALLGCLSKILTATLLTVLVLPMLSGQVLMRRKIILSLFSILILSGVVAWYFVWVPYLNETYGLSQHFFMGMTFQEGIQDITTRSAGFFKRFYDTALKYAGFTCFVVSLAVILWRKNWIPFYIFLIPFTAFLLVLIKTGASVIGDQYYMITAIPSMAFIAGLGLSMIKNRKIAMIILLIIGIEAIGNQWTDFRVRAPYSALAGLESVMDKYSERNDLIAINAGSESPTAMYFAHRRGWVASNEQLADSLYVNNIKSKGCKFVLVVRQLYGDANVSYPVVYNSSDFKLYKLE
jgi:4-amino-4-deoxy-L-arabinose transferase-like glycosyltransferase